MIKGCILPWMHLYSTVDGQFNLCCHINTRSKNAMASYKDDISTIWNNEKYKKIIIKLDILIKTSYIYKTPWRTHD